MENVSLALGGLAIFRREIHPIRIRFDVPPDDSFGRRNQTDVQERQMVMHLQIPVRGVASTHDAPIMARLLSIAALCALAISVDARAQPALRPETLSGAWLLKGAGLDVLWNSVASMAVLGKCRPWIRHVAVPAPGWLAGLP